MVEKVGPGVEEVGPGVEEVGPRVEALGSEVKKAELKGVIMMRCVNPMIT